MRKLLVVACILSFLAVALTAVNLLAPNRLAQAAERLPLVSWVRLVDAKDASRVASVDAGGSLQVADQRLQFEQNDKAAGALKVSQQGPVAVGNFPPVQSVAGTVNVGNLPATQDVRVTNPSVPVSGTVNVGNLPPVQSVAGTVNVGNLPATQDVRVTNLSLPVSGSVNVGNLPSTQQVAGTVSVGNLPAVQAVSGNVNVGNLPAVQDARIVNASMPVTGAVAVTNLGGFDPANVVHGEQRVCSSGTQTLITVPDNKRLMLTYAFHWWRTPDVYTGKTFRLSIQSRNPGTGELATVVSLKGYGSMPDFDRSYQSSIVFQPHDEVQVWADLEGAILNPVSCASAGIWGVLVPVAP
ncbi:MAG: hypothetical protein Q8O40_14730 [Chloroflexota bacterium]|nr:hypothetical protein [Chloroflexota bacterium]